MASGSLSRCCCRNAIASQGNGFIELNDFEKTQKIFDTVLIFGIANTGEHLYPAYTRNRQSGIATRLVVRLNAAFKQIDQNVCVEDGFHER